MPSFANAALGGRTVTMSGTKPFTKHSDGPHGALYIKDTNGAIQDVLVSTAAVAGFSAATAETASKVFADNDEGNAIVDEILADFNA